jgi:Flp pilus assembly protein TadG
MRRSHTPHRDDHGVVAIELVLILPFLLMIIMGFLVLGNYLGVKGQASNLARDGARKAALFPGTPLGDARLSVVGTACPTSPRDPTKSVTVKATLAVDLNSIPLIPVVLPSTLNQQVTMRCGG